MYELSYLFVLQLSTYFAHRCLLFTSALSEISQAEEERSPAVHTRRLCRAQVQLKSTLGLLISLANGATQLFIYFA